MHPQVSIIIPVFNHIDLLTDCLDSIRNTEIKTSYEIVVVDDCSTPETAEALNSIVGIRLIRNHTNLGFLRSCNRAALNAKGKYLAFLNSDTRVTDGWLDELLDVFNRFENVGIVGSKLLYPDGTLQECGGIIWKDASGLNYGKNDEDPYRPEYVYTKEVDYVSGASLLIEKSLFIEVGLFDYRYSPAYYEDTDLAFKIRKKGKRVFVEPNSIVLHHEGASCGTSVSSGTKRYQEVNRQKFREKWKSVLDSEHFEPGKMLYEKRDRSHGKSRILVIDHYVPVIDRDAGSRCIYSYLKLLTEIGYNVTFLPHNFHNPQPYTKELGKLGIEVLFGPQYLNGCEAWMKQHLHRYRHVLISRPNIAVEYLSMVRKYSNAKILFFGHDIHHLRLERELQIGRDVSDQFLEKTKDQEYEVWKEADILLYPSAEEVNYISDKLPGTEVLEVPIFFYKTPDPARLPSFEEREGILFIANFNHPPNRDGIEWFFETIYPLIDKKIPKIPIQIVGSAMPEEIRSYESDWVTLYENVSDIELRQYYQRSRIAIAPLRFGAGVKGKVLEAMYHQLPMVTTNYGAQGIPSLSNCTGITDYGNEFAELCIRYYSDQQCWADAYSKTHSVLFEKFSYQNARDRMKQALS